MYASYEDDFYGWIQEQADYLKHKNFSQLDIEHLVEELETMGRSERRVLESHLEVLLLHLLKIRYQPEMRTRSWDLSIKNARIQIEKILKDSPSLKPALEEILKEAYRYARQGAAEETGLSEKAFAMECPWTVEEVL